MDYSSQCSVEDLMARYFTIYNPSRGHCLKVQEPKVNLFTLLTNNHSSYFHDVQKENGDVHEFLITISYYFIFVEIVEVHHDQK